MGLSDADQLVTLLGVLGAALALLAGALVVRLHGLPTGVDAIREGVSGYALTPWATLYRTQVRATGLAAGCVAAGCALLGGASPVGLGALLVVAVSRVAIAEYPTDPSGTTRLSPTGRTHALLASAAFIGLGIAAPLLGSDPRWEALGDGVRIVVWVLSVAVPISVLATFGAGAIPGARDRFGLVERTVYATGLAWLAAMAAALTVLRTA